MQLTSSLHRVAPVALSLLLLPVSASFGQCESDARWQRIELNLGTGVAAPIVKNTGRLGDDVVFAGLSAVGTASRFHADGRTTLLTDPRGSRISVAPLDADGAPVYGLGERLDGDVTLLGGDIHESLAAWGSLSLEGLWGEASARVEVTGRTLRSTWTGPAADLARIGFRFDGVAEAQRDPRSGEVLLTPGDAAVHPLTLYPAKVRQGDTVTHLPFDVADDGSVTLGEGVPEGAELEILLVFAPYTHDRDAVADGRGGFAGVGPAIEALGPESGRDIAVVRVDETGRGFRGMTILASSGADTFAGITAADGDLWIGGEAGAGDFPVAAKGKGHTFPSPFIARLGASGTLEAGTHLGGHGLLAIDDLAADASGRLFVSGTAATGARTTEPIDLVTVLPSLEGAADTTFAVAELTPALDAAPRIQTFEGAPTALPLEVRPGCDGRIEIGLVQIQRDPGDCPFRWNRYEYPQSFISPSTFFYLDGEVNQVPANPPFGRWGYHALRWKEQFGTSYLWSPPVLYSASAAASSNTPNMPTTSVGANDHLLLDAHEAHPLTFPNGDPAGTWLENDALDYLELALGASAYLEFWGSPAYANLRYNSGQGGQFLTGPVAITDTAWCANRSAGPQVAAGPLSLCQQVACQNPPCKFPIDAWDDQCAADPVYSTPNPTIPSLYLATFDYDHWDGVFGHRQEVYWQDVRTRFDQASPNLHYVADPPGEAEFARSFVDEGVQRELGRVVEDVPVTVTHYVDGEAASTEAGLGLARAVDRIAAE